MATVLYLPSSPTDPEMVEAAWALAYAAFWPFQEFTPGELSTIHHSLGIALAGKESASRRFTQFCERIILEYCRHESHDNNKISPLMWFHPKFQYGFARTESRYITELSMRKRIPGYASAASLIAEYYWNRISRSPKASFRRLRKRLVRMQEYELLSLFCLTLAYHFNH